MGGVLHCHGTFLIPCECRIYRLHHGFLTKKEGEEEKSNDLGRDEARRKQVSQGSRGGGGGRKSSVGGSPPPPRSQPPPLQKKLTSE